MLEGFRRGFQLLFRLGRFDHRPVERCQRFGQQGMFAPDPVEPARGTAQLRKRGIAAVPYVPQFFQVARQFLALLHVRTRACETLFLTRLRLQRRQLGQVGQQQVLLRLRLVDLLARSTQRLARPLPFRPGGSHRIGLAAGIAIEQGAVAARVDEAAIVMLAMQFHQRAGNLAQQCHANGLVVDERLGTAIRLQLAADDQRLAFFDLDIRLVQRLGQTRRQPGELETGGYAGPVLARTNQAAVRAIAQHQAERIEQDGLARPRLARQHTEAAPEFEIERFDEDDVANGKPGQHAGPIL